MMLTSDNVNILSQSILPTPVDIRSRLPLTQSAVQNVIRSRQEIHDIFDGRSRRLMVIVGPCSIHHPGAALKYARKLKMLADEVRDRLMIVMRVYFEKPRTTLGWKGLIYDPDLNNAYNIGKGIELSRDLLLKIVDIGLPVATEMLDPILAQYIADAVSWTAIGARTTEAQTHRQLASGLSMPVGFKNATDGSVQIAIDAVATARSQHSFIGLLEDGHVGIFRTAGNPYGHIVLRGGVEPNYGSEHIAFVKVALKKARLPQNIVIDCSHANSGKQYQRQQVVFHDVLEQIVSGETAIKGVMLESYLKPGKQPLCAEQAPDPEISITDGCIGWEETESLIRSAYNRLG